jgi:tetratricopeptide (TPR) repeat protein
MGTPPAAFLFLGGTVRHHLSVCLVFATMALEAAFAETDEWQRLMEQGSALQVAGNYAEAANSFRDAARVAEAFGVRDPRLPISLNALATQLVELGRYPDAQRQYRRALAAVENAQGKQNTAYAQTLGDLGLLYLQEGQAAQSEPLLRESMAIYAAVLPLSDEHVGMSRNYLAQAVIKEGHLEEAESLLTEAIRTFQNSPAPDAGLLGVALNNLAGVRFLQGRKAEAIGLFEEGLGKLEVKYGAEHPLLLRVLCNMANVYAQSGRRNEADAAFRRCLAMTEKTLGARNPFYGTALANYAAFLRKTGHKTQARTLEARSREVLQDSAQGNGTGMTVDVSEFRQKL